ncbi:hypothetical protein [Burkholderia ubonensis]|nr:hypothetical protein [Burkholderia ubonensis]
MNRATVSMFGLLIAGLVVALVIVLATAPTPQEKAALAAAKPAKAR